MNAAATNNIIAAVNRVGLTIPTATQKRLTTLKALGRVDFGTRPDELVTAVAESLAAGKDPYNDKAVAEAHRRFSLGSAVNWRATLDQYAATKAHEAVCEVAPEIFNEAAGVVAEAGARLAQAAPTLEDAPLGDQAEAALRGGERVAQAWMVASEAVKVIDAATSVQSLLITYALRIGSPDPRRREMWLRVPHANATELDQMWARRETDTFTIARRYGLTITGADLDAFRSVPARITADQNAADAAAEGREVRAIRARMGGPSIAV